MALCRCRSGSTDADRRCCRLRLGASLARFHFWPSADQIKDNHARAIMRNAGTETLVIKRLSDDRHDWIGSIVVDYAQPTNIELHTSGYAVRGGE